MGLSDRAAITTPLAELVRRIASSRRFERAARHRELLQYLTEQAAAGNREIHEQDIGVEVFARARGYDTSHDTIVRVQVAQLRKKLELYFAEEGKDEPFVLEVARGTYQPVLLPRKAPVQGPATSLAPRRFPALVMAAVVLVPLALYFAFSRTNAPSRDAAGEPAEAVAAFWRLVFPPTQTAQVVLADSTLVLMQEALNREFTLEEYTARADLRELQQAPVSADFRTFLARIGRRRFTSLADIELVRHLAAVLPNAALQVSLVTPGDFNVRALNGGNTVLFGGRRSNPWVGLFDKDLNFSTEFDLARRKPFVLNRRPEPGEQPVYEMTASDTFTVVALVRNPARSGRVLILSGLETAGSEAAIRLVTTEKLLAPVWARLGTKATGVWELLLRNRRIAGAPQETQVVAVRTY